MKILVVGGGGREHAICHALARSRRKPKLYCAPGNAGIAKLAECVPIGPMEFDKLIPFAKETGIDLTVVGMDDPLAAGLVDLLEENGLKAFGPKKNAAIIEASKAFSKGLMKKYGIPTAAYEVFDNPDAAREYLEGVSYPVVLKADGLALGKGVLICNTKEEALAGIQALMEDRRFGDAGSKIVIEVFLTGREVSVLAFSDGTHYQTMASAQDHKRALDGDQGLNTGGMGAFSPSPFYTDEIDSYCREHIFTPTVAAMKQEGREFKGVLYFGLMLTEKGPKVLEYNARFGDPEAQAVLPRLETDLVDIMEACINGSLDQVSLQFSKAAAVCVVLASGGYPEKYEKGFPIEGLDYFEGKTEEICFHAGTKADLEGRVLTNGGRVLGITALGEDLGKARDKAYAALSHVSFENAFCRRDIGKDV